MISHTQITHVQHTQTNRLIHIYKYILTPPGMCSKQLPALEWMNNLQAIIYFTQVYIVFDFQKLLTYRSYMTAWSKYSKNGINKENIHIHRDLTLPFWEEIEKFNPPPAPPLLNRDLRTIGPSENWVTWGVMKFFARMGG